MVRPCFLVIDSEYAGSLSTRKLVIETAKLNVITAYSSDEALATLHRFPAVDGIVIDSGVSGLPPDELTRSLKSIVPGILVIYVHPPHTAPCPDADHNLESFEPAGLVALLRQIFPEAIRSIERHEMHLSQEKVSGHD